MFESGFKHSLDRTTDGSKQFIATSWQHQVHQIVLASSSSSLYFVVMVAGGGSG